MPSTKKKSPSEAKKKSLASTSMKAKSSVKKSTKKNKNVDANDGSYLQGQEVMPQSSAHK